MTPKNYHWHKLAGSVAEIHFCKNGFAEADIDGKKICLTLYKDALYACTAKCPHAGGTMAQGYTDALGNIVCPTHRYKFSLKNGRNTSGEGFYLKIFPVEVRTDGVFVGIEENNWLNWLK